jgi:hypothetical protein
MMRLRVGAMRQDLQIIRIVVSLVAIHVVDFFFVREQPADLVLDEYAVERV